MAPNKKPIEPKKDNTMKIYNYPSKSAEKRIDLVVNRGLGFTQKQHQAVARIIDDIKKNGDKALINYTNRFASQTSRNILSFACLSRIFSVVRKITV